MTRSVSFSAFTDPAVLAAERQWVFANSWQYVGHAAEIADVSCLPLVINDTPLVLTREGERLRALINVCAHRGSIICKEAAQREALVCPYHAWRYRLDGTLVSAPRSGREEDFDPAEHALESLRIGRWGPFLFVALSETAPSFEVFLADLPDQVKTAGVDVDSLVFHTRSTFTLRANWKLCVENFLECYHCRVAHPGFAKTIDTSADGYELVAAPTYSTQYGPVRDNWIGDFDPRGEVGRGQFHLLYPNTAINIMPGRPNMSIGPINPIGPDSTFRFLDYFFAPGVPESWIDPMMRFDDQVGREDLVLVEDMQRGVAARPERRGTLFMDSEHLIAHFEDYVTGALG
jgi:phenylpropionate dioxygenase-like ring-hydroxylating dioxygenase large terminal subunit